MNIKVKINLLIVNPASALRAVASVTINDEFMVHNVRLVRRNDKTFVSMPSVWKNGGWKNICHPIKSDLRKEIEAAYTAEYNIQTTLREVPVPEGDENYDDSDNLDAGELLNTGQ